MEKILFIVLGLAIVVSTFGLVRAGDVKTVAVLPFDIHSSENIDYIRDGVWDMLISRVSVSGKIDVLPKHDVMEAVGKGKKSDLTVSDAYSLGKKMKADYVVFGSITKIGNSVSLDGKLLDIATYKSPVDVFSQSQGMDDVIPKIGDFAKRIDYHILGQVPGTFGAPPAPAGPPVYASAPTPQGGSPGREPEAIDAVRTRQGTFTAVINPDFITAPQSIDRKGFWMSQRIETEFKGMDIGDVDGDGKNEVVCIDVHNVMIYKRDGRKLKLVQKIAGESHNKYLSVDVADVTGSGKKEIVVTNLNQSVLESFVLQYKDGKYTKIAKNLRWFLRVVDISGTPVLLGQAMGVMKPFGNPIYEIVWEKGKFKEGKRMDIPEGLSVYGLAMEPLDKDGPNRIISLDDLDYLRVYEPTQKRIEKVLAFGGSKELMWKSYDVFGGSNNFFDLTLAQNSSVVVGEQSKPYVNVRILSYDMSKSGKKDLIIVKNLSTVGRVFENMKLFSASEIHCLQWNGLGFVENWKTKQIQGYITDYQIKDIDNDGKPEVVLALVLSYDLGINNQSVVVAYTLNL